MSMTYAQFILRLTQNIGPLGEGIAWTVAVPEIIDYAEQRIYRDLNLISTTVRDGSSSLTASSRDFTLPTASGTFMTVYQLSVITPAATAPAAGTRNPLIKMSVRLLDYMAQTEATGTGLPTMWAMVTDQQLIVGPSPDAAYRMEVVGTVRPTPLSASNTTTFLTLYLPDLFMAAAMVFLATYRKPWVPDSPQDAEGQYMQLLASANSEEMRRRYNLAVNTPVMTNAATASLAKTGPIGASVT